MPGRFPPFFLLSGFVGTVLLPDQNARRHGKTCICKEILWQPAEDFNFLVTGRIENANNENLRTQIANMGFPTLTMQSKKQFSLTSQAKKIRTPFTRYVPDLFIPATSRYLTHPSFANQNRESGVKTCQTHFINQLLPSQIDSRGGCLRDENHESVNLPCPS